VPAIVKMQAMTIRIGKSHNVTRKHRKEGRTLRLGALLTALVGEPVVFVVTVVEVTVRRVTTGLDSGLLWACKTDFVVVVVVVLLPDLVVVVLVVVEALLESFAASRYC